MNHELRDAVLQLKRERIVGAAVDLFHARGYANTTLDQVAEDLGVSKPFIYAHFKSKAELLAVICAQGIAVSQAAIDQALAAGGSPRDQLARFAHDFMLAVLARQKAIAIYTREEKCLAADDRQAIAAQRRDFDRKLTALLDRGVAVGDFNIAETTMAALAIGGIVSWASVWFRPDGRLPGERIARGTADLVLAMSRTAARPQYRRV